jgi:thiol-disulfide isomerase/thioredoxin
MFNPTFPRRRLPLALLALFSAALACAPAAAVRAADDEKEGADAKAALKAGDPAPKLYVSKWVKGEPVKEFEKGKVYVIECWATWCGPCRASIPHVTELQNKYKDKGVTVIGMNVWEQDTSGVEPFVTKMGDKMGYAVALDEPLGKNAEGKGKTSEAWLAAAGQNGIPCTFIVDKASKVAWIGHPMAMDRPLALIVEGTFDPKKEAELQEKVQGLQQKIGQAMQADEYDKALPLLDELAGLDPTVADRVQLMKVSVLVQKKDYAAANAQAAKLAEGSLKDQPQMQGQVALMLLTSPEPDKVDADLALKLAERALAASPDDLATRKAAALAYAAKQQYGKAAEQQAKVVEELQGPSRQRESKLLDEYKAKAAGGEKK